MQNPIIKKSYMLVGVTTRLDPQIYTLNNATFSDLDLEMNRVHELS
jgi:hypothetical protein